MNIDAQKLFVGLMDFFSILLPGALMTYLAMDKWGFGTAVLGARYERLTETEAWAVFLFASYLFGHLVFMAGSWLDEFYDWARRHTLNTQITLVAYHGRLIPPLGRILVWLAFKDDRNQAVSRAAKIKATTLRRLNAADAINTFQWSKALLNLESPASLSVV